MESREKIQEKIIIGLKNKSKMTTERIKEIQLETAYPESLSVQQALLKVWNECEQAQQQQQKMIEQMQLFEQLEVMLEGGNSINPDSVIRSAIQLTIGKYQEDEKTNN
jgi:hypothetical protein